METSRDVFTTGKLVVFESIDSTKNPIVTKPALKITYKQDGSLDEKYLIHVKKDYNIVIEYGHPRGKKYALRTLGEFLHKNNLKEGLITDYPRFKMRGIIEGFYGTPWSHEDRLDCIRLLDEKNMNAYIYAPKDDVYHRNKWREDYPEVELKKLLNLINEANNRDIDFYFSISPGKDFNYTLEEDFKALFHKIDVIIDYGVTSFCLLLDDIDYKLEGKDLEQFKTPGMAHSYICNRLNAHLKEKLNTFNYIMCPTEYWQNYDTPYRNDIKNHLDENILVYWTGYNTIAEFIPNEDGENVQQFFGHELVLWDNYPVNDVTTDLLFMGPLVNRGSELHLTHRGMVSNPMIEWSLSIIPVMTMADYMWNPATYHPENSWRNAIIEFGKEFSQPLMDVLKHFRYSIISYDTILEVENMIKQKNVKQLLDFYTELMSSVDQIKKMDHPRFIEQFTPWLQQIAFDNDLIAALYDKDENQINNLLTGIEERKHTVGTNFALKMAKELGYYTGKVYKKTRVNFWEE